MLAGFAKKACTFNSGPRAHTKRCALDVAKRSQSLESRIDPAIKRNVTGSHVSGLAKGREFIVLFTLVELAIAGNFGIAVVGMGTENLIPHVPAKGTANNDIGSKVLLAGPSRRAYASGHPVSEQLR